MKTETSEAALPAPAKELRRELWERLRRLLVGPLAERLRFADVDAVVCLIEKQLGHSSFLPEALNSLLSEQPAEAAARETWLEGKARELCDGVVAVKRVEHSEQVVVVNYVADCDLVAEYLHAGTSEERRKEIWGLYWAAYQEWISATLLGMLRERFADVSGGEPALQKWHRQVEEKVFGEAPFRKTVSRYRVGKGKTLAQFLQCLLTWRCCDARREFASEPGTCELLEDSALASTGSEGPAETEAVEPESEELMPPPESGEQRRTDVEEAAAPAAWEAEPALAESAAQRLQRCLAALREPEERAVVELRYRAHVDPKFMARWTLERAGNRPLLVRDFEAGQQALRKLQEEEIPARESEHRQAYARRERKQADLELQGWSRARINQLRQVHGRTIEYMQAEMNNPAATSERRQELAFQIACVQCQKASHGRLAAQDRLIRYRGAQHPWVRSQEEIARLLGLDQVTVSRRLKSALLAMRQWLRSNPPPFPGATAPE